MARYGVLPVEAWWKGRWSVITGFWRSLAMAGIPPILPAIQTEENDGGATRFRSGITKVTRAER